MPVGPASAGGDDRGGVSGVSAGGTEGGGAGSFGGGGACDLAAPMTVTTLGSDVAGPLHADDRDVYFLGGDPIALHAAPKTGGGTRVIAPVGSVQNDAWANDFAVDAATIYIMKYGHNDLGPDNGSVTYVDKTSGASRSVAAADIHCRASFLLHLAVSNGDVYWVQDNSRAGDPSLCTPAPATPMIGSVPAGAASQQTLVAETAHAPARALLADDVHVFWADDAGVWRVAKTGGAPELLSRDTDGHALAIDGHSLFVARASSVYAISAPLVEAPIYDEANVTELASDGHALFIAGDNGVARVSPDGRARSVVTPDAAYGVTVDDRYVYFATAGGLFKACK
jgi:hypothetical protein